MKNKSFFIVIALCAGLQGNISFANNNQSWADYFRSKWAQFTTSRTASERMTKALAVAPLAYVTQKIGPGIILGTGQQLGLAKWAIQSPWEYNFGTLPTVFIWLVATISAVTLYKHLDANSKIKIKDALKTVINNPILYPTRSSKINALLKKDEFLQYIHDEHGLVQEACNDIIGEINAIPYPEEQKTIDQVIDARITQTKNLIINYATLEEQIKALEKEHTTDIPGMEAYLSVYYRLKNKQAVENALSKEEKASRQSWATSAREARTVSKPLVD